MLTAFEQFGAVFLVIWRVNAVPTPLLLALHLWVIHLMSVLLPLEVKHSSYQYIITFMKCISKSFVLDGTSYKRSHCLYNQPQNTPSSGIDGKAAKFLKLVKGKAPLPQSLQRCLIGVWLECGESWLFENFTNCTSSEMFSFHTKLQNRS